MRRRSAGASSASRARADGLRAGRFFGGGFAAAGFFLGAGFAAAGFFLGAGFAAAGRFLGAAFAAGFAVLRVLRFGWGFALAIACAVALRALLAFLACVTARQRVRACGRALRGRRARVI